MSQSNGTILNIDDEAAVRDSICAYLEDSGFDVINAENGKMGLKLFEQNKPDLVLSDLQMPQMGGLELLGHISKDFPDIPVIVTSGASVMSDAIQALRLGAWDYLIKPITDLTVLEHAVCKALERSRLTKENTAYRLAIEKANEQLSQSLAILEEDQSAGHNVQMKLLPKQKVQYGDCVIEHHIKPSLYLSGDFVGHFQIDKDQIGVYLADVSGHGASSAFVTVLLDNIFERLLDNFHTGESDLLVYPEKVMKKVSDDILSANLGKYLTMVYCVYNTRTNKLCYSVGGHYPSPLLFDGESARYLNGSGFAVGIYDKANYESQTIDMPERFRLSLITDGIFELLTANTLEENEKILQDRVANFSKNPQEIIDSFIDHEPIPDDVTILTLSRL